MTINLKLANSGKAMIIIAILLIAYGYGCRFFNIYFFWESRYLGWMLLLAGAGLLLFNRIVIKNFRWREVVLELIAVVILFLVIILQTSILIFFPGTQAYKAGIRILKNHNKLISELGMIKNTSIVPVGQIQWTSAHDDQMKAAKFNIIVKGEKRYRDVTVYLEKLPDGDWTMITLK